MVVEQAGTQYQLKFTIEKSTDLKTWTTDHEYKIEVDIGQGKQFLRVRVE